MASQVLDSLFEHAVQRPDSVAVSAFDFSGQTHAELSYSRLICAVSALSSRLANTCDDGSTLLLSLENGPDYVISFLAAMEAGMNVLAVSPDLSPLEVRRISGEARVSYAIAGPGASVALEGTGCPLVTGADLASLARDAYRDSRSIRTRRKAGSLLLLSSGTTGTPKLVLREGPSLDAVARNMIDSVRLTAGDRVLTIIPMCHSYGVESGLLGPIAAGATILSVVGFDIARTIRVITQHRPTVFPGVPFMFDMLSRLTDVRDRFRDMRCAYSAGGRFPRAVYNAFRDAHGISVGQLYGTTECGAVAFNAPDRPAFDPESVGLPMRGVSFRILDPDHGSAPLQAGREGRLAVSSPSMFSCYVGEGIRVRMEDYFVTGDLGRLDTSGALYITGRTEYLVNVGGRKVNPQEVEQVIAGYPGIAECAVIPLPVSDTLTRLKAFLVLSPGCSGVDISTLRRHVRGRLSGFKVPRLFEVRDRLPKTALGKIRRDLLTGEGTAARQRDLPST